VSSLEVPNEMKWRNYYIVRATVVPPFGATRRYEIYKKCVWRLK